MPVRRATKIELMDGERVRLEAVVRSRMSPVRLVQRSRIVLMAAEGKTHDEIAAAVGVTRQLAARWRERFLEQRFAGIEKDAPGRGRKRQITGTREEEIVRRTREETPPARTHWSLSTMAAAAGVSDTTVRRIWARHGLKPHLVETFKLSNDPAFKEKLEDVVGLYLTKDEKRIVLCCDEKSQIQALDRTQPGLPLKRGRAGTMTHDYKRNGRTTLFAAMDTLTGRVTASFAPRHRHQEWLKFLRKLDREMPPGKELHVICDNYGSHKHAEVRAWLEKKKTRFFIHFTPTSASWLNMVERFFRDLTENALRRGVFTSVDDLHDAIDVYLIEHNRSPKPFIWTKTAKDILAKVIRARAALKRHVHSGGHH
jgi:transposase